MKPFCSVRNNCVLISLFNHGLITQPWLFRVAARGDMSYLCSLINMMCVLKWERGAERIHFQDAQCGESRFFNWNFYITILIEHIRRYAGFLCLVFVNVNRRNDKTSSLFANYACSNEFFLFEFLNYNLIAVASPKMLHLHVTMCTAANGSISVHQNMRLHSKTLLLQPNNDVRPALS